MLANATLGRLVRKNETSFFVVSLISYLPRIRCRPRGATHINVKITQFDSSHATKTYITEWCASRDFLFPLRDLS